MSQSITNPRAFFVLQIRRHDQIQILIDTKESCDHHLNLGLKSLEIGH